MRRLLTPRWLALHLLAIVLVAGMLGLAWWQFTRASGGNMLSWGYTVQWPVFAGFVVLIWVREMRRAQHGAPAGPPVAAAGTSRQDTAGSARQPVITRRPAPADDAGDEELAAYNRYLAWLNAHPEARPADYPG